MDLWLQDCSEDFKEEVVMADATAGFFDELGRRGREPLLEKARGTIRFDLVDGTRTRRWLVTLDKGEVSVSRRNAAADCVVRADRKLFEAMVRGDVNGMAAYLRGELTFEGDPEFLVLFQRVVPGPATRRRSTASRRDPR
jgi:putative sterol carrier protein